MELISVTFVTYICWRWWCLSSTPLLRILDLY